MSLVELFVFTNSLGKVLKNGMSLNAHYCFPTTNNSLSSRKRTGNTLSACLLLKVHFSEVTP